jgi:xanthine dehydrogenase accessory factor
MRRELLDLASDLARRSEPFAIVTVVARKGPVSAQAGDAALVTREGALHGWIGGACTQPTVVAEVRRALADGRPRLVALDPDPDAPPRAGVSVFPMTCHSGGSVEILIQPVLPAPRLLIFGLSPTARALARLAGAMGYAVHAVDPAADDSAFPGAAGVWTDPRALPVEKSDAAVFAVVATQGQWDEEAVLAALSHQPAYLGVVASSKRFAEMRGLLTGKASAAALAAIKSPAGLDLGARLPEEIALSILAEIVKERRAASKSEPAHGDKHASEAGSAPAEELAQDPVCGMTVKVSGARHRAQHQGRELFFCCAGCRERFLAAPERYSTVEAER